MSGEVEYDTVDLTATRSRKISRWMGILSDMPVGKSFLFNGTSSSSGANSLRGCISRVRGEKKFATRTDIQARNLRVFRVS